MPCMHQVISGWSRKGKGKDGAGKGTEHLWAGHWLWIWERRYCHSSGIVPLHSWALSLVSHYGWEPRAHEHSEEISINSSTYLRSVVWCANGNWKPLFRKPESLNLHLSFDWLMSQTLGVGFAVRLLQSWFIIIIIINAILKYTPWYCKEKVSHLWTVKCQVIFFPKIVIKFGGRHFAKLRRQSVVEWQGGAVCPSLLSGKWCSVQAPSSGGGDSSVCDSSGLLTLMGLLRDIWVWFMLPLVPVLWVAQSCITVYRAVTRTGSIRINCKILLKCIDCWQTACWSKQFLLEILWSKTTLK